VVEYAGRTGSRLGATGRSIDLCTLREQNKSAAVPDEVIDMVFTKRNADHGFNQWAINDAVFSRFMTPATISAGQRTA
jgi:hypothetical protein